MGAPHSQLLLVAVGASPDRLAYTTTVALDPAETRYRSHLAQISIDDTDDVFFKT